MNSVQFSVYHFSSVIVTDLLNELTDGEYFTALEARKGQDFSRFSCNVCNDLIPDLPVVQYCIVIKAECCSCCPTNWGLSGLSGPNGQAKTENFRLYCTL